MQNYHNTYLNYKFQFRVFWTALVGGYIDICVRAQIKYSISNLYTEKSGGAREYVLDMLTAWYAKKWQKTD